MVQLILIDIGAGAATALLFGSVASGSLLSVALFYLAPLPILIAALGWSHWAGLVAAVVAATGLAAVFNAFFFMAFLLGIGLPAWWLGYLALLARPTTNGAPGGLEWYPVGHLVMWAALVSALVVTAGARNAAWPDNVETLALPDANGRVDLAALMRELGRRGVNEVLVEGGARLNGALVAAGLVDELLVYFAPCLVYDPALGMAALPEGLARLADRIPFAFDDIVRVGTDLRVRARALHKED